MNLINNLVNSVFSQRLREIDLFRYFPCTAQEKVFSRLIANLAYTDYGKSCGILENESYETFAEKVRVVTYEDYEDSIKSSFSRSSAITADQIKWYSKSSGTTSSSSKYLPVTSRYLKHGHLQGGKDCLAILYDCYPDNSVLCGKSLTLGGSLSSSSIENYNILSGDISAIMIKNTPFYAKYHRAPSMEIALTKDFNQKVDMICRECSSQNITSFAGVPSWNMVMLERLMKYNNATTVPEVWKNVELFIHGGVSFEPYREQYKKMFPNPNMKYIETYNASEGFFAIQDDPTSNDMLLMLDYDIFYEFMPMSKFGDYSSVVPLSGVEAGVNYAMIISTSAGLWRYQIGDTVKFTSLAPHKIKITGRTKLFINVFGEEVIVDNCDKAISRASLATGANVVEYMVAPIFMEVGNKGAHQWVVEFSTPPTSYELFEKIVDETIIELNSDYKAKRFNNTTLNAPQFNFVEQGSFYNWFSSKGKLGGQNKVPRLSNSRDLMEEFINFADGISR